MGKITKSDTTKKKQKNMKKKNTHKFEMTQIWSTHQSLMNVQSWPMCRATITLSKERNRLNTITSKKHKSPINTTTITTITTMWLNRSIQTHHHHRHKENTLEMPRTMNKKHNHSNHNHKHSQFSMPSIHDAKFESKLYATYTRKMRCNRPNWPIFDTQKNHKTGNDRKLRQREQNILYIDALSG